MSTETATPPAPPPRQATKEEQPYVDVAKKRHTGLKLLGILVFWLVCWAIWKGQDTLAVPFQQLNGFDRWLNDLRDKIQLAGQSNWFFHGVLGTIGDILNSVVEFFQKLISIPAFPRPVPEIGWFGVIAIAVWITYVIAGLRSTLMVTLAFLSFGVVGLWPDSMDTLIITLMSVVFCIVVGIPLGILMARNKVAFAGITPVLDLMQTIPAFCY